MANEEQIVGSTSTKRVRAKANRRGPSLRENDSTLPIDVKACKAAEKLSKIVVENFVALLGTTPQRTLRAMMLKHGVAANAIQMQLKNRSFSLRTVAKLALLLDVDPMVLLAKPAAK